MNTIELHENLSTRFNLSDAQAQNLVDWLNEDDSLDPDVEELLCSSYVDAMPYGVAMARTGDPQEWLRARLTEVFLR